MTKSKYEKGAQILSLIELVILIDTGQSVWLGWRVWNAAAAVNLTVNELRRFVMNGRAYLTKERT